MPLFTSDPADAGTPTAPPQAKKQRYSDGNLPIGWSVCSKLLQQTASITTSATTANATAASTTTTTTALVIPVSLLQHHNGKIGNNVDKLRKVLEDHGLQTSAITAPRAALSVFTASFVEQTHAVEQTHHEAGTISMAQGKDFLTTLFGMHPEQAALEAFYATYIKGAYCLSLFCKRLRQACPDAMTDKALKRMVAENEQLCRLKALTGSKAIDETERVSKIAAERAAMLMDHAVKVDPRLRRDQLENEYDRVVLYNSTLSNVHVQLFLEAHECVIESIYLNKNDDPKHDRFTITLYDPIDNETEPPRFTFVPSLHQALAGGPRQIAVDMVASFWSHLLRRGYFTTETLQSQLTDELFKFFLSGIASDLNVPLLLSAHFAPTYPLSLYLHGKAGTGKSSLARKFSTALNATIEEFMDPEILVRFVKQNLNKPLSVLELELESRPNNNDLSVMSIIQGRRQTMGQSKPGLVVIDMEEMASNKDKDDDPNQLKVAQLISQRFAGRSGAYKEGGSQAAAAPRNSDKQSISGDASLISIFTSNYELEAPSQEALQKLEMFHNLRFVEMKAVSGHDRREFAFAYLDQCIKDRFADPGLLCKIDLDIPLQDGDTRPLVRHLRMLCFYICTLVSNAMLATGTVAAKVVQTNEGSCTVSIGAESIQLELGSNDLLFPVTLRIFDPRTSIAIDGLRAVLGEERAVNYAELSVIVDFWLAGTLAPCVIVSKDVTKIKTLVASMGALYDAYHIPKIVAGKYKMMKSLYDRKDTPNLRDDLLRAGAGRGGLVAVELVCQNEDAQHCIRDMIEDSPSMTAFSTEKSALRKVGLLFGVHVTGEITPEIASRASLIL